MGAQMKTQMKPVLVEEDVYDYITRLTMESGLSPSVSLRKALGIDGAKAEEVRPVTRADRAAPTESAHELSRLLEEPLFRTNSTAVARMLRVLREAHDQRKADFTKVLAVQGRNRSYFARSEAEILRSGKSTQPRQIPGTGYWVMTNSPTPQKQDMVREVLHLLGFSKDAGEAAAAAIV